MYNLATLIDVPATDFALERAYDINDNGWIVAEGYDYHGNFKAVLLTPVPEPSTLALATFGALGLLIAARRKR